MIDIQAIDHINLTVRDLDRSVDFYTRVFGLAVREDGRSSERPFVILGRRDVGYMALHQRMGNLPEQPRGPGTPSRPPGINHWGFVVEDFDGAHGALQRSGVRVLHQDNGADGVIAYPRSRSLYVADPDGNEIELTSRFGGDLG
jgi:catechol 2,3-dioxygenase-like lactoylglutathione lyase family enzyme